MIAATKSALRQAAGTHIASGAKRPARPVAARPVTVPKPFRLGQTTVAKRVPVPCPAAGPKSPQQAQPAVTKRFTPCSAPGSRLPRLVNPAAAKRGVPPSAFTGSKLPRPINPVVMKHASGPCAPTTTPTMQKTRPAGISRTQSPSAPRFMTMCTKARSFPKAPQYMKDLYEARRQVELSSALSQVGQFPKPACTPISGSDEDHKTMQRLLLDTVDHLIQLHRVDADPTGYDIFKYRHAVLTMVKFYCTSCPSSVSLAGVRCYRPNPVRVAQAETAYLVYTQPWARTFWWTSFRQGTAPRALIAIESNLARCKAIFDRLPQL